MNRLARTRRPFLGVTLSLLTVVVASASSETEHGMKRGALHVQYARLPLTVRARAFAIEPAAQGKDVRLFVMIKNTGKLPLYFSYPADAAWIQGFRWSSTRPTESSLPEGGMTLQSSSHGRPKAGEQVCVAEGDVFMLPPGAEMGRDVEMPVDSTIGPQVVDFSMRYTLLVVNPNVRCQRAEYHEGEVKFSLEVLGG